MPRRPRIFFPGATYHVMLRGNNGNPVFYSDAERCRLCLLMHEGAERFGHQIIAFCFMTNHIHIAVQVNDVSPSRIVHNLAFRYTQFINRRHQRVGHLFQGRFKSVLVDNDRYLKELIRYIHLNPVRAGLVETPQDYRWSSHRAYINQDHFCWLASNVGLEYFHRPEIPAAEAFHQFVLAGIGREPSVDFSRGNAEGILGREVFIDKIMQQLYTPAESRLVQTDIDALVSVIADRYGVHQDELQTSKPDRKSSHVRAIAAVVAKEVKGVSLKELADYFHQDPNAIYKAAARLEVKLSTHEHLREEVDSIMNELSSSV